MFTLAPKKDGNVLSSLDEYMKAYVQCSVDAHDSSPCIFDTAVISFLCVPIKESCTSTTRARSTTHTNPRLTHTHTNTHAPLARNTSLLSTPPPPPPHHYQSATRLVITVTIMIIMIIDNNDIHAHARCTTTGGRRPRRRSCFSSHCSDGF